MKAYKISAKESPFSLTGEKTITRSYTEDFFLHKEDAIKIVKGWIARLEKFDIILHLKKSDSDTCMVWCGGDKFFLEYEVKLEEIDIKESF